MFILRQRRTVVNLAAAAGDNHDEGIVGGNFQRALGLDNGVVAGYGVAIQCVAEGIRALTDNRLAAREGVGRALVADPAGLHCQAVDILTLHRIIRQGHAAVLAGLAAGSHRHRLRGDGQRAGRGLADIGKLVRDIRGALENRKRCHRVHGFFASTRHDVRHGAVGGGCPSEAFGQARHGEVFVRRLRQRCAVVGFAAASRDNRDRRCVGDDFQHTLGLGDGIVAGFGVAIQCVAEGIHALTDRHLAAREAVGRAFAVNPAGLLCQTVSICAFHFSVRQCRAVELTCLAAAGQGYLFGKNGQRAGRGCINIGEIGGHICSASEYLEL